MFRLLFLAPAALALVGCTDPVPAFDVVYPAEWKLSVSGPAEGFVMVVNTSQKPLSLATLQVKSVTDNHPMAEVRAVAPTAPTSVLSPGMAGGELSGLARDLLVGPGRVGEPRTDTEASSLALELADAPAGTYDVAATVTLSLDGRDVALPMTLHVVPGPTVYLDPAAGRRVQVYR